MAQPIFMTQQPQPIVINLSQAATSPHDEKSKLLKLFPSKFMWIFSFLQITFGFMAALWQVFIEFVRFNEIKLTLEMLFH